MITLAYIVSKIVQRNVIFMIKIIKFSDGIFKESWFYVPYDYVSNWYSENSVKNFKKCFTCHYCPKAIMTKVVQLTCIVISLEVLDDESIFPGIARRQERGSFVCKHR